MKAMFAICILLLSFNCHALEVEFGIGVIDQEFGYQRDNPVGILKLRQQLVGPMYFEYYHASGLLTERTDWDRGVNISSLLISCSINSHLKVNCND